VVGTIDPNCLLQPVDSFDFPSRRHLNAIGTVASDYRRFGSDLNTSISLGREIDSQNGKCASKLVLLPDAGAAASASILWSFCERRTKRE
jgi:hypothetical protein